MKKFVMKSYLGNGLQFPCGFELVDTVTLGLSKRGTFGYWAFASSTSYTDSEDYKACVHSTDKCNIRNEFDDSNSIFIFSLFQNSVQSDGTHLHDFVRVVHVQFIIVQI